MLIHNKEIAYSFKEMTHIALGTHYILVVKCFFLIPATTTYVVSLKSHSWLCTERRPKHRSIILHCLVCER